MSCCWHAQPVEAADEAFWCQFWSETVTCVQDVFALIPAAEIRALREESPSNLATLCYKAVEKLVQAAETGCHSHKEEQTGSLSSLFLQPVLLLKCHVLTQFTALFRKFTVFTRCMKCRCGIAMRILSVCLSVRLSVRPSHA